VNLELDEDQQLLVDAVRRFVQHDYGFEARREVLRSPEGSSEAVWRTLAEIGLTGLLIGPEHGGAGGGVVDLMGVMEVFGEALLVEPFLATVVLGAQLVARAGSEAQRAAVLPEVAQGTRKLAFAHTEVGARYDLGVVQATARRDGAGWRIDGEKRVVLGAPLADALVVSARTPAGVGLFLVDRGDVGMTPYRTLDGMRAADVVLADAAAELLGAEGDALPVIEEVVDVATVLVCAEAIGVMRSCCDATLEHLKTRRQFGVPIGSFQALQHRMVDMAIAHEQARSMALLACSQLDGDTLGAPERARVVSAAKIKIADDGRLIAQEAVQLHGGMGMTEELKVSHSFRRLTVIAQQFGDAEHHLARFARA